jgi:hypothetical protein
MDWIALSAAAAPSRALSAKSIALRTQPAE